MMGSTAVPAADLAGVNNLLALLKDPEGFQKRMDGLAGASAEASALIEEAATAKAEADARIASASAREAQIKTYGDETDAWVRAEESRIAALSADLKTAQEAFAARKAEAEADLESRQRGLVADHEAFQKRRDIEDRACADKLRGVEAREAVLAQKEASIDEAQNKAAALIAEYEQKLGRLKALVA